MWQKTNITLCQIITYRERVIIVPKTVALASYSPKLANELIAQGFKVVDGSQYLETKQAADAYLYTSYRPDTVDFLTAHPGHADISIGNYHYTTVEHNSTIMLNITGLKTREIIDSLHHHLAHRPHL